MSVLKVPQVRGHGSCRHNSLGIPVWPSPVNYPNPGRSSIPSLAGPGNETDREVGFNAASEQSTRVPSQATTNTLDSVSSVQRGRLPFNVWHCRQNCRQNCAFTYRDLPCSLLHKIQTTALLKYQTTAIKTLLAIHRKRRKEAETRKPRRWSRQIQVPPMIRMLCFLRAIRRKSDDEYLVWAP